MSAQLFVVATPIGHLDDMTFRAIDILKSVSVVAAEDTRQSAQLFKHYNISTPLISDPGFKLVRAAQEHKIRVIPVPGACAAIAALSAVGLPSDRFSFEGFLPSKASQRISQLEKLKDETQTLIFYEAPHRILDSVKNMAEVFGEDRPVGFAREITKTFETIKKMTLKELVTFIENDHNQEKGEIVVVVGGATAEKDMAQDKLDELLKRLLQDLSVKAASQLAADLTGIKKKVAYQRALELTQDNK